MAVLAVAGADRLRRCHGGGPDRRRSALRNGFPLERRLALGGKLAIDLLDPLLHATRRQMTAQLGTNAAGMHRRGADATRAMTAVEFNREQDIGGLRAAIAD